MDAEDGQPFHDVRDSVLDVRFEGEGAIEGVTVNGEPLPHPLHLPDGALATGDNTIVVTMAAEAAAGERLRTVPVGRFTHVHFDGRGALTVTLG